MFDIIDGIPFYLLYLSVTISIIVAALHVFTYITPHNEFDLINKGNMTAAMVVSGTLIGMTLGAAASIFYGGGLIGSIIWTIISAFVQLFAYFCIYKYNRIDYVLMDNKAIGLLNMSLSIALGILQFVIIAE